MSDMPAEEIVLPTLDYMKVTLQEIVDRDHFVGEEAAVEEEQ